jgi:D-alanine-D-alanine ligase
MQSSHNYPDKGMAALRVCVLQPDYADSNVDYRHYDPPRNLDQWLPFARTDYLFLRKATTYRQLREAARKGYDIFINLCEGYLDWDIPSVDVIWALEKLKLPYTGPSLGLYDPSKPLMKYVAQTQGVCSPAFIEVTGPLREGEGIGLHFPLFVKPALAGDSLGIDDSSLVHTIEELRTKCQKLTTEFDRIIVEEYVPGREFTVLVAADPAPQLPPLVLRPLEFVFQGEERFKTYDLKVTRHHPERNIPVSDSDLDQRLREAARSIFNGFRGQGYARLDFRLTRAGELHFLDINFACSIFYTEGYEGSADYILKHDPLGIQGFLCHIIAEGRARHRRRRRPYDRRGNGRAGFGIFATENIDKGDIVFFGEERPQSLATRAHIESTWPLSEQESARRYAYPLSDEILMLWDPDPEAWAPQNHSCFPNTCFEGLNIVALRDIKPGEELTLDYADFCDETMVPFDCLCGSPNCRGRIEGSPGNSVTRRECARQGR